MFDLTLATPADASESSSTSLRGHNPLRRPRPSLSSLPRPHADHRDVRARSASSPSPLRATGRHRDEYLMTPAPPRSLSSLYRFRPAMTAHVLFAGFARHLPRNRLANSTKGAPITSFSLAPPDRRTLRRLEQRHQLVEADPSIPYLFADPTVLD